jgi:hypothetical protein
MNLVSECYITTGRKQYSTMTLQKQTLLFTEEQLTSSRVDFLVNPIQQPGNASVKKMNATSGQRCLEQFERFNRVGSWAKMFAGLLIGTGDWYSTRCNLTWKLSATKSSRFYFQLVPKTLPTEGIGFGLLPTVTTKNVTGGAVQVNEKGKRQNKGGTEFSAQLHDLAKSGLLPTPTTGADHNTQYQQGGRSLKNYMGHHGMLPTPATRDYKGARSTEALEKARRNQTNSLPDAFHQPGKTSQLNPRFVAEMMGFPPNWTELPFQSGEMNQSKPTEMP